MAAATWQNVDLVSWIQLPIGSILQLNSKILRCGSSPFTCEFDAQKLSNSNEIWKESPCSNDHLKIKQGIV